MKSRAILLFLLLSSSSKLSNGTLTSSYFTETSQELSILKSIRNTLLEMNLMSCAMVCLPDDACFGIGLKPPKCVLLKVPLLDVFTWQTMEKGYQWFLKENYDLRKNCSEGEQSTTGVYLLRPDGITLETAYCEYQSQGECSWQYIQKNIGGSVDFNRSWTDYKHGFGIHPTEFWLGNDNIHELTKKEDKNLHIELKAIDNQHAVTEYQQFIVHDQASGYALKLGTWLGENEPGDSLSAHHGSYFSTYDNGPAENCALVKGGGWWYTTCGFSNLNGKLPPTDNVSGILWDTWHHQLETTSIKVNSCDPVHQFTLW